MKEVKSIKTGRTSILSEQEYADLFNKGAIDMKRFIVTDLQSRPIIPSMKVPAEIKNLPKKK